MGSLRLTSRTNRFKNVNLSVKDFNDKRNNLLVIRNTGGLGDIFMHRMMFEDFKILMPEVHISFALPRYYWPAVSDHPFVDSILDSTTGDFSDFIISYNTSTACGRYEASIAPRSDKHRSDIWAEHCGIRLTKHDMHIRLSEQEQEEGKSVLARYANGKPVVLLSPISAMDTKNLDNVQMNGVAAAIRDLGFSVVTIHKDPIPEMKESPVWSSSDIRKWMSVINAADAVVSVDTATFHCAGGMKKPLVGIFTWSDGLAYGKWFDFVLVQKNRAYTPGWDCGPCYHWPNCPKCKVETRKPCITDLTVTDIMLGVRAMLNRWTQLRPKNWSFSQGGNWDSIAVVRAAHSSVERVAGRELPVLQATG